MDTPHPAHTPETSGEPPEVKDIDEMLNERGFAAFLENYDDAESFEVTEENKEEIAARFRAFEASTTVVKQFEKVMDEKLQTEGKGRMKPEERKAYKEHVAELAAKNPDELLRLQSDLRALEEAPEKIREREAELARLKESWSTDKVKAGIAELAAKKADIEKSLKEADATKFSRMQRAFFTNFGARFSMGKIAGHLDKKIELTVELQEVEPLKQQRRHFHLLLKSWPGQSARLMKQLQDWNPPKKAYSRPTKWHRWCGSDLFPKRIKDARPRLNQRISVYCKRPRSSSGETQSLQISQVQIT